jgi:hypothetical protein
VRGRQIFTLVSAPIQESNAANPGTTHGRARSRTEVNFAMPVDGNFRLKPLSHICQMLSDPKLGVINTASLTLEEYAEFMPETGCAEPLPEFKENTPATSRPGWLIAAGVLASKVANAFVLKEKPSLPKSGKAKPHPPAPKRGPVTLQDAVNPAQEASEAWGAWQADDPGIAATAAATAAAGKPAKSNPRSRGRNCSTPHAPLGPGRPTSRGWSRASRHSQPADHEQRETQVLAGLDCPSVARVRKDWKMRLCISD